MDPLEQPLSAKELTKQQQQQPQDPALVAMEVASIVMAQQYSAIFQRFHQHLLLLEDFFFSAERTIITTYELSTKLVAGVIPFSVLEAEVAQSRFVKLVKAFEKASSEELSTFQKETGDLRVMLQQIIAKGEQTLAAEERKRKDDFNTLQNVCRREVSAFIATIRSDNASTGLEVEAIQSLQAVLATKVAENDALRTSLFDMTSSRESERALHRAELDREREANRTALHEDRSVTTTRLHELMLDTDKMRAMHAEEIAELYARSNLNMTRLRSDFSTRMVEIDTLREALDKAQQDSAREKRLHQEEKNKLLKLMSDLECAHESLKLEVATAHSDAQLHVLNYENFAESRKLMELQQFKKRVAVAAGASQPSSSVGDASRSFSLLQQQGGGGGASTQASHYSPRSTTLHASRGLSASSSFAVAADVAAAGTTLGMIAASPPPYRDVSLQRYSPSVATDRSRSPNGIPLRSPSETFLRLSNLSGSLKDSLAGYGGPSAAYTSPQMSSRSYK